MTRILRRPLSGRAMKRLFLAVVFLSPASSWAVPTAQEVIERAIGAQGGTRALRSIISQRQTGTLTITKDDFFRESFFLIIADGPTRSYYESPVNAAPFSDKLIFASDGAISWTQNDGALAPYRMPDEEVSSYDEEWPFFFDLEKRGVHVKLVGKEPAGGVSCTRLDYTFDGGREEQVYFREDNGLLHLHRKTIATSIGDAVREQTWLDYRSKGDMLLAHTTEILFLPDELHVRKIETWDINPDLDDDIFMMPIPPPPNAAVTQSLLGEYQTTDGTMISVSATDAGLRLRLGDEPAVALTPVTHTFYMYRRFADDKANSRMANVYFEHFPQGKAARLRIVNSEWNPIRGRRLD